MAALLFIGALSVAILLFYRAAPAPGFFWFTCSWLTGTGSLALSGFFNATDAVPSRFVIVLAGAILYGVFCFKLAEHEKPSPDRLMAMHLVRLPVEIVLYLLYLDRQVPLIMTFAGWNFDVLVPLSCMLILALRTAGTGNSRLLLICWNLAGMLLLLWIVLIAILSSPLPFQQLAFDQPNMAVMQFPYVWLPAGLVPLIFVSHLLAIKTLLRSRNR